MSPFKRYFGDWSNILPCLTGPGVTFDTCQYIAGDAHANAVKCGKPTLPESPYCPDHHARCYRQPGEAERLTAAEIRALLEDLEPPRRDGRQSKQRALARASDGVRRFHTRGEAASAA